MSIEIKVPVLPESVADATVVTWHKQPGDKVSRDETLVDLETDKVVLEVPAPEDGVLGDILKPEGETVLAEEILAIFNTGGASEAPAQTPTKEAAPAPAASEPAQMSAPVQTQTAAVTTSEPLTMPPQTPMPQANVAPSQAASQPHTSSEEHLSPAARRLVSQHGIKVEEVASKKPDQRLTKSDIKNFLDEINTMTDQRVETHNAQATPQTQMTKAPVQQAPRPQNDMVMTTGERPEKRVPMTRLRQRIAERLLSAQHNTAMLTTFNEVNMQPILQLRAKYKDRFEKMHGTRLGFLSFFSKAVVEALKQFPSVNASIENNEIVYHGYYDVGVAISTDRGLVVPVLRDADQLTMAQVEKKVVDFAKRAREGKLSLDEITGGTFSITNGGVFGSLLSTPILNPPQSAILGMHTIQERPVVENDKIVIRPMMYLALSYDHRIIDGKEAITFLVRIKEMLEDPTRLLMEV